MRYALVAIALIVSGLAGAALLAGAAAALQEPRPFDVVMTAIRVELHGLDVAEVPQAMDEPSRWLQRAHGESAERDGVTRDFALRGWALVEQLGGLRVFAKGGLRYRLICRMLGARYQLCEAEGRP
jgi:hypothetical protein